VKESVGKGGKEILCNVVVSPGVQIIFSILRVCIENSRNCFTSIPNMTKVDCFFLLIRVFPYDLSVL